MINNNSRSIALAIENPLKNIVKTTVINILIVSGLVAIFFFLGIGNISGNISGSISKAAAAEKTIDVWWPTESAKVQGTQPFKSLVQGMSVNDYAMYWQVDGGNQVWMDNNSQDYPHKEASVDLSGWHWRGNGPYVITFTAKDWSGNVIAQTNRIIYIGDTVPTPIPTQVPLPVPTPTITISPGTISGSVIGGTPTPAIPVPIVVTAPPVNPPTTPPVTNTNNNPSNALSGKTLYVDTSSQAAQQVKNWLSSQPGNAALINKIAANPQAVWLGSWYSDSQTKDRITSVITVAKAKNAVPSFVLYNIPERDCGSYSAGGANNPDGYKAWINLVANAIGNNQAIVIFEPDALAQKNCLNINDQNTRLSLLKSAVATLKSKTGISVYLDAGHSGWISSSDMADSLKAAGVDKADGFSLNVSNFQKDSDNVAYGTEISSKIGNKHFVIDTSRNGNGSNGGEWCNPSNMALGQKPTTSTGQSLIDAYLWVKSPGESDGTCNGGPSAGTWWPSYALALAEKAKW